MKKITMLADGPILSINLTSKILNLIEGLKENPLIWGEIYIVGSYEDSKEGRKKIERTIKEMKKEDGYIVIDHTRI